MMDLWWKRPSSQNILAPGGERTQTMPSDFNKIRRLQKITSPPTQINIVFKGSLPASRTAIGEATTPPTTQPAIACQWLMPSMVKKVTALASVTKNSVSLTEPVTYFGVLPLEIRVLVTRG